MDIEARDETTLFVGEPGYNEMRRSCPCSSMLSLRKHRSELACCQAIARKEARNTISWFRKMQATVQNEQSDQAGR
jgi:hypothetical protein